MQRLKLQSPYSSYVINLSYFLPFFTDFAALFSWRDIYYPVKTISYLYFWWKLEL